MLRFQLRDLMKEKDVTYKQVSKGANVAISTLQKVIKNETVQTDVIDRLLNYFGCELADLVVYIPDNGQDKNKASFDLEVNPIQTELGRELYAIREKALASGMKTMTAEEIEQEIAERRGERV